LNGFQVFIGGVLIASALSGGSYTMSELKDILAEGAAIEKLAGDLKFTEGPVWRADGHLLFSDIPADTIYQWTPGQPLKVFRKPCGNANGHTLDRQGRLISCEHSSRRVSRTEKDGTITTLADRYEGRRLNSPNDVVVRSDGSIYFTDPTYGIRPDQAELDFRGVYRIGTDGRLTLLVRDFVQPNGLAFSPDEKRLYIADSQVNHIRVFDVQPDGTLTNGRLFADMRSPGKDGAADGMKVDTQGRIFATGPEGVWVFAPDGKLLGKIIPPEVPANVAFGDKDYRTLYMTARTGLYRVRLKTPGIKPGP
jgi:gluconolactonase